jgi:hypothetical protein
VSYVRAAPGFRTPISSAALVDLLQDERGLSAEEQAEVTRAASDVEVSGRLERSQRLRLIALAKRCGALPSAPVPSRPKSDKPFSLKEWVDSKPDVVAGAAAYEALKKSAQAALANKPLIRRAG